MYAIVYVARRPHYRIFANAQVSWPLAKALRWPGLSRDHFSWGVIAPDVFIVAMLAPLGAIVVSAFRALTVVSDLTFVVPTPLQSAAQIVIGQRLGARDLQGAQFFFLARCASRWQSRALPPS